MTSSAPPPRSLLSALRRLLAITALALVACPAFAYFVLPFPGLLALIQKVDAIAVVTILEEKDPPFASYGTYRCILAHTIKGELGERGSRLNVQLLNTRNPHRGEFGRLSTYLVFLIKKRTADEPTDYRTLEVDGSVVRLAPFTYHGEALVALEKQTPIEQIRTLVKASVDYWESERKKEATFLQEAFGV